MIDFTSTDQARALLAISDMIARSEKAQAKFAVGTAQHSLQINRIHALRVAQALISRESDAYTNADLARANAPIASLISKSEKAQNKLSVDSWQHNMLRNNLAALRLASELLEARLLDEQP